MSHTYMPYEPNGTPVPFGYTNFVVFMIENFGQIFLYTNFVRILTENLAHENAHSLTLNTSTTNHFQMMKP